MKRREAKAIGSIRYFTGKPCKHGHIAERHTSDGACLECSRIKSSNVYKENREEKCLLASQYRASNPEKILAAGKKYRETHREKRLASKRNYWKQYPEKRAEADQKKRARKINSLPLWFGEFDAFVWYEAFLLGELREKATGIKWHSDHMIPMRGRDASGLHVANNCQVIPAVLNIRKSNSMIFTEPGEWVLHA